MRTFAKTAAITLTTALLALAPPAAAVGNPELLPAADQILALPVEEFEQTQQVAPYDWSNDGCSVPGGMAPYMKLFTPACKLHDFGYRNYGTRNQHLSLDPTGPRKQQVDERFLAEMRRLCDKHRPGLIRNKACHGAAHAFYDAVRIGGHKAFYA
ncbi:phospholipase A2 [Streptomyces sp. NPDC054871]